MTTATEVTLGQRLTRQARARAHARRPRLASLARLRPLLEWTASRPTRAERFRRVEPPAYGLVPAELAAEDPGVPLPPTVRERLRVVIGTAPVVQVHDGKVADAFARRERADAVAVGDDVYFRHGRFRPYEDAGFALLAHEAVHVAAATEPNASLLRSTTRGRADEEVRARAVEEQAGPRGVAPVLPRAEGRRAGPLVPERAAPADVRPLAAAVDRAPLERAPAPPVDFGAMGRDVHRELLAQIRSDFERGA